jgi:hypothetical protein
VYKKSEKENLADNQCFEAWRPEKKPVQQQIQRLFLDKKAESGYNMRGQKFEIAVYKQQVLDCGKYIVGFLNFPTFFCNL